LGEMGIWILDVSPVGLYYPGKFLWGANGQVQKGSSGCPGLAEALILCWELHTKHLVRAAAEEGDLRAVIPACKRVAEHLTIERIGVAVEVDRASEKGSNNDKVVIPPSEFHPNAWLGTGWRESQVNKLAELVSGFCREK